MQFAKAISRRKQRGGYPAFLYLLLVALPACTMIGDHKVAGWPQLTMVEHYVPQREMRDRCSKYVGFGMSPEACAEFDFAHRRCDIWFSADFPPQRWIVEHEREHCAGYDHVGSTTLADAWSRYQTQFGAGSLTADSRIKPGVRGPTPN